MRTSIGNLTPKSPVMIYLDYVRYDPIHSLAENSQFLVVRNLKSQGTRTALIHQDYKKPHTKLLGQQDSFIMVVPVPVPRQNVKFVASDKEMKARDLVDLNL